MEIHSAQNVTQMDMKVYLSYYTVNPKGTSNKTELFFTKSHNIRIKQILERITLG